MQDTSKAKQNLKIYIEWAQQHSEIAIALREAVSRQLLHHKSLGHKIIQYLCHHFHVLRTARRKLFPAPDEIDGELIPRLDETLSKLFSTAQKLFEYYLAQTPRQRLRGWKELNKNSLSAAVSGESLLEMAIQCLIQTCPPTTSLAEIEDLIRKVFGPSIKSTKTKTGLPRVVFVALTQLPNSIWLVGATAPGFPKWFPAPLRNAILNERTQALAVGGGPRAAIQEMLYLETLSRSALPGYIGRATYRGHVGEAYGVNSDTGFAIKALCQTCRRIHRFNQAAGLPQSDTGFAVPACAEVSWVSKAARRR